jgi:sortase A
MRLFPGLAILTLGGVLLAAGLAPVVGGLWGQRQADARWQQIVARPPQAAETPAGGLPADVFRPVDGLDFRLTVPSLGYSEVVREGVGLDVLALGPGHYPKTAWPGQPGNVGVAAHNVYWLRFTELRPGDELRLEARYGGFRYRVTGSRVVAPADSWVLAPVPDRQLTLTTCWPVWAGQFATQRLAIFAASA